MKLSRTVSYALQASLQLAGSGRTAPVPCNRLAAEGAMPERFLLQILRVLVAHGILASTRGVDGGYSLGRPADEISLLEVIEAIDGPLIPSLPVGDSLPSDTKIKLERALADVTARARHDLGAITLAQLLPEPSVDTADAPDESEDIATSRTRRPRR